MTHCVVCRGSKRIRVAVYHPLGAVTAYEAAPDIGESSREYPCPECSADVVPHERLRAIKDHIEAYAEYSNDPRFISLMRGNLAAALARKMLGEGLITFEQGKPDHHGHFAMRGTVGIVSPRHVAKFEERVAERQFEVAEALVAANIEEIGNWGSYYHGREGGSVGKWQAIEWLQAALKRVRSKYG